VAVVPGLSRRWRSRQRASAWRRLRRSISLVESSYWVSFEHSAVSRERFKLQTDHPRVRGSASYLTGTSGLELPCLEFLPGRAEVTELVNGRARWREREHIKGFGEHLFQVILGGDADGHVRIEILPACFRHERRDVVDRRLVDVGILGRCNDRCSGPRFSAETGNCTYQILLQLEQIVCLLHYKARKADVLPGDGVVLECLQAP